MVIRSFGQLGMATNPIVGNTNHGVFNSINLFGIRGNGLYPYTDPWGRPFARDYFPDRLRVAGLPIAGKFRGVYDGCQADLEYIKKVFSLQRSLAPIIT